MKSSGLRALFSSLLIGGCLLTTVTSRNGDGDDDNTGVETTTTVRVPTCDTTTCARCLPNGKCQACVAGAAYNPSTKSCQQKAASPCDLHCASTCNVGPGLCDSACDSGFYLTKDNVCLACDSNCDLESGCSNAGTGKCDSKCIDGYTLVENMCYGCSKYCTSGCDKTGASKCDSTCQLGYALSSQFLCLPCDVNCDPTVGCSVPFSCNEKCVTGYAYTAGTSGSIATCQPCNPYCAGGCSQAFRCDSKCVAGYTICSKTQTCQPCSSGCDATVGCDTAGPHRCDKCQANYFLDTSCMACYPCALYCDPTVGCSSAGTCNKCLKGYNLVNGKCTLDNTFVVVDPSDNANSPNAV